MGDASTEGTADQQQRRASKLSTPALLPYRFHSGKHADVCVDSVDECLHAENREPVSFRQNNQSQPQIRIVRARRVERGAKTCGRTANEGSAVAGKARKHEE